MAYTYHELKGKTIQELRDIAKGNQGTGGDGDKQELVQGYSQMNKDHLLPALCKALGIDVHEHHLVVGIDKPAIKAKMRTLKQQRQAALEATAACSTGVSTINQWDRPRRTRCFRCEGKRSAPHTRCVRRSGRAAHRPTGTAT